MKLLIKYTIIGLICMTLMAAFAVKKWYMKNDAKIFDGCTICLINVLDKEEFEDAHITGSFHISLENLSSTLNLLPKNKELVFYCSNNLCTASRTAAETAVKKGFKKVYIYEGGMAEWYQLSRSDEGYQYEGPAQLSYLQIVLPPLNQGLNNLGDKANLRGYVVIRAEELQKMLKEANILT